MLNLIKTVIIPSLFALTLNILLCRNIYYYIMYSCRIFAKKFYQYFDPDADQEPVSSDLRIQKVS